MIKQILSGVALTIRILALTLGLVLLANVALGPSMDLAAKEETPIIKQYAPYLRPLVTPEGDRYCYSSSVKYKDSVFTITNNHCCQAGLRMSGDGKIRVGDQMESIIYRSVSSDICILTSSQKDTPIRVATRPLQPLDKVLVMGYPRGTFLTPRWGYVVKMDEMVCIPGGYSKECQYSNVLSTITYPGNSGSPVFNSKGEVVNVIYAGYIFLHTAGISVPYFFLRGALDAAVIYQSL